MFILCCNILVVSVQMHKYYKASSCSKGLLCFVSWMGTSHLLKQVAVHKPPILPTFTCQQSSTVQYIYIDRWQNRKTCYLQVCYRYLENVLSILKLVTYKSISSYPSVADDWC